MGGRSIGTIMDGVTGRMEYRRHILRSITMGLDWAVTRELIERSTQEALSVAPSAGRSAVAPDSGGGPVEAMWR